MELSSIGQTDDENRILICDRKLMPSDTLCKKNTGTNNSIEELSDGQTSPGQSMKSSAIENHLLIKVQNYDERSSKQNSPFYAKKASVKISHMVNRAAGEEEITEQRNSETPKPPEVLIVMTQ